MSSLISYLNTIPERVAERTKHGKMSVISTSRTLSHIDEVPYTNTHSL